MKRQKTILLACLGLAFWLSFILNNKTFAGFTDSTGPPSDGGSCVMDGEFYARNSQMDGPSTVSSCYNCITYETMPIYSPISGLQIGMLYKRRYEAVQGLVQSCRYSTSLASSCNATYWVGGAISCGDYTDYTDTDTGTDTETGTF